MFQHASYRGPSFIRFPLLFATETASLVHEEKRAVPSDQPRCLYITTSQFKMRFHSLINVSQENSSTDLKIDSALLANRVCKHWPSEIHLFHKLHRIWSLDSKAWSKTVFRPHSVLSRIDEFLSHPLIPESTRDLIAPSALSSNIE